METLVETVKVKHEMQSGSDILKKIRIIAKYLTKEVREDFGRSKLMKQANSLTWSSWPGWYPLPDRKLGNEFFRPELVTRMHFFIFDVSSSTTKEFGEFLTDLSMAAPSERENRYHVIYGATLEPAGFTHRSITAVI